MAKIQQKSGRIHANDSNGLLPLGCAIGEKGEIYSIISNGAPNHLDFHFTHSLSPSPSLQNVAPHDFFSHSVSMNCICCNQSCYVTVALWSIHRPDYLYCAVEITATPFADVHSTLSFSRFFPLVTAIHQYSLPHTSKYMDFCPILGSHEPFVDNAININFFSVVWCVASKEILNHFVEHCICICVFFFNFWQQKYYFRLCFRQLFVCYFRFCLLFAGHCFQTVDTIDEFDILNGMKMTCKIGNNILCRWIKYPVATGIKWKISSSQAN